MAPPQPLLPFAWQKPLTPYQSLKSNPALFIAQYLYKYRLPINPPTSNPDHNPITLVCISDTHNTTPDVPNGDILLHAGDLTNKGVFKELQAQLTWLNTLPHKHKIVIGGNHDLLLDPVFVDLFPGRIIEEEGAARSDLDYGNVIYLNSSSTMLKVGARDVKVYGSPLTPQFGNWAFQYPPIRDAWKENIPADTDILLTHGPPKGHLDMDGKGCEWLLKEIWRKRPKLVVFGHIHEGHGREDVAYDFVQAVYDGVTTGEKGLLAVVGMAFVLCFQRLWYVLSGRKRKGVTTLINAAVVGGQDNVKRRPATMV
jgi:predicted MPP superfamily phosphohydrolase